MCRFMLFTLLLLTACSGGPSDAPQDGGPDTGEIVLSDVAADTTHGVDAPSGELAFDTRSDGDVRGGAPASVHGWILLDGDPEAMTATIEAAAAFGVNHVQLSHGLIMNIDDVLDSDAQARVDTLNQGIELAHEHGMKAFIWAHEFSETGFEICYAPDDPVWEERAEAYRQAFALLPGLDGVVLMFGSAPAPPWFTVCGCDWCLENYDDLPLFIPPPEERIRMITEHLGAAIRAEGKELLIRTFVHEPAEVAWHEDGLSAVQGVDFMGMHKGPVQDWQPYNPHHPNIGQVGDHPSVMELDLAGEYYGLGVLPFCSPGYYRYRLDHLWNNKGIGVVARVERGAHHALGTPNEVNLWAVRAMIQDHETPLDAIWSDFLQDHYGLAPDAPALPALQSILEDSFPIRLKSHYVLGIWALEKGSDLPTDTSLDQFNDRGKMPKWDPDWQETWDRLDQPDRQVVLWIWQEGTEAVVLAEDALLRYAEIQDDLAPDDAQDLHRQLLHQLHAARAWRAVDLFTWSLRAASAGETDPDLDHWRAWAIQDLQTTRDAMIQDGLQDVPIAGPGRIQQYIDNVTGGLEPQAEPQAPEGLLFSPIRIIDQGPDHATISFSVSHLVTVTIDHGLEIPDYGQVEILEISEPDTPHDLTLTNLTPGSRTVLRLRATWQGTEYRGGDFWLFLD